MCLTCAQIDRRVQTAAEEVDTDTANGSTIKTASAESVPIAADATAVALFSNFENTIATLRAQAARLTTEH